MNNKKLGFHQKHTFFVFIFYRKTNATKKDKIDYEKWAEKYIKTLFNLFTPSADGFIWLEQNVDALK